MVVVAVMDELVRSLLLLSCWSTSTRMRLLGSRFLARKRGRFIESRRKEREIFVFVFFFSKEKIKCTRYYYEKTDWIYGPDDEWTSPHIYIYMYMCIYISFLRLQATKSFTWWRNIFFFFFSLLLLLHCFVNNDWNQFIQGKRRRKTNIDAYAFLRFLFSLFFITKILLSETRKKKEKGHWSTSIWNFLFLYLIVTNKTLEEKKREKVNVYIYI